MEAGLHGILLLVLSFLPLLCPVNSSPLPHRDRQTCTKLLETLNDNEYLLPEAALSGLCNRKIKLILDSLRDLGTVVGTLPLKKEANYGASNSTRLKGVCVYANSYR